MKPIDVVLSLLPSLSEKERDLIRQEVGMALLPPCERLGHQFKVMGHAPAGWFNKAYTKLHCVRCGTVIKEFH